MSDLGVVSYNVKVINNPIKRKKILTQLNSIQFNSIQFYLHSAKLQQMPPQGT